MRKQEGIIPIVFKKEKKKLPSRELSTVVVREMVVHFGVLDRQKHFLQPGKIQVLPAGVLVFWGIYRDTPHPQKKKELEVQGVRKALWAQMAGKSS